jgi:hypothetical protein
MVIVASVWVSSLTWTLLLRFHRLVQPVGPLPAVHQTTGELESTMIISRF